MKVVNLYTAQNTLLTNNQICDNLSLDSWPEKDYSTGFHKHSVDKVIVNKDGITNDVRGYPSHKDQDRAILLYPLYFYDQLKSKFPEASKTLIPGNMGENISIVNTDETEPSNNMKFCIGDVLKIGTCILSITYHRNPCSKIDARHNINPNQSSITEYCKTTGLAGIFAKVVRSGKISVGDKIEILLRPNPNWDVRYVAEILFSEDSASKNKAIIVDIFNIKGLGDAMKKKAKAMILDNVNSANSTITNLQDKLVILILLIFTILILIIFATLIVTFGD